MKSLTKIRKQRNYVFLQLIAMLSNLDKVFNLMSLWIRIHPDRNVKNVPTKFESSFFGSAILHSKKMNVANIFQPVC